MTESFSVLASLLNFLTIEEIFKILLPLSLAIGVGIGFFAVGALLLALLWKCGIVRKLDMCEEEQILFVCVWPIELLIVIPTRLLIQTMMKQDQQGQHVKK